LEQAARAIGVGATPTGGAELQSVGLVPRILAYLVDSVILLAVLLVFFVAAGGQLLAWGEDPPDSAYYTFFAVLMAAIVAWSALNLALLAWRGQTAGQYVLGHRVAAEDGSRPNVRSLVVRWFALNPLLFNLLLAPVWFVFGAIVFSLTLNVVAAVISIAMVALCIVAPPLALVSMLLSRRGRALHDLVSGTTVVRLE